MSATTITEPAVSMTNRDMNPPTIIVKDPENSPAKKLDTEQLKILGTKLTSLFGQYKSDRVMAEQRWLRNQRQYLGIYDPDIEKVLGPNRSKAYPRITRIKCISVLSRIMNLMFQGNERNWELQASPDPEMSLADVKQAIKDAMAKDKEQGVETKPGIEYMLSAVQELADKRANVLSKLIDDQLQELGGDQTADYVSLNRKVLQSGILYGLGVLVGPFAKKAKTTIMEMSLTGEPSLRSKTIYKPVYEILNIWDFYPDMSAKTLNAMDGYFTRVVMSRHQVRKLADREDFFGGVIKRYLNTHVQGNYRPLNHETELRSMGVKTNVNEQKSETTKYEAIVWHGPISGAFLSASGVDIDPEDFNEEIDAEVWVIDNVIIKASINPWRDLGVDVKTVHTFLFDEDDTSPVGFGLPNAVRDSQMGISAATRMLMDNASVVCGPQLEINTDLLRPDQDLTATEAYKMWYREGSGQDAQSPAVRNIAIDSHMKELQGIVEMFMKFADAETFVGPATGGDMAQTPSEPMRTAAGASMMRGDAALPFKDIIRSFDQFTQSVIESLVQFNREFNPDLAPEGDYNVIARGATSLMAKELRGMQIDQLSTTLKPEELIYVDQKKMVEARFAVRDLQGMLLSDADAARKQQQSDAAAEAQQKQAQDLAEAQVRKLLSDAFKNIAQGNKNSAAADAQTVKAALEVLEKGMIPGGDPADINTPTPAPVGAIAPPTPGDLSNGAGLSGPVAGNG